VDDLVVGDCLNDPGVEDIFEIDILDCAETHQWEVFQTGEITEFGASYPAETDLVLAVDKICFAEFEPFVGLSYQESVLIYDFLIPIEASWEAGDRAFMCLIGQEAVTTRGSVRDSGL